MYWYILRHPIRPVPLLAWGTMYYPIGAGISCTIPGHVLVYLRPNFWDRRPGFGPLAHCRVSNRGPKFGLPFTMVAKFSVHNFICEMILSGTIFGFSLLTCSATYFMLCDSVLPSYEPKVYSTVVYKYLSGIFVIALALYRYFYPHN